jgi:8-oxo-dGTP pyrophosphatase MutT (NUDIX family)
VSGSASGSAGGDGFRIVGEEIVWKGRRLSKVGLLQVATPGGDVVEREVLHHPGAVAVVPLHADGTVTLVRQYRSALDRDIWEVPAGLRDVEGEDPASTARRELAEEAGLAAGAVEQLVSFHNSPGITDEQVVVFLATDLRPVDDDRQGIEEQHMEVARVGLDEAVAMTTDGRITDAKTLIGLLLTARTRPDLG